VSLRQNGVGTGFTSADAILPIRDTEHQRREKGLQKPVAAYPQQIARGHRIPAAEARLRNAVNGRKDGRHNPGRGNQHPGFYSLGKPHSAKVAQASAADKISNNRSRQPANRSRIFPCEARRRRIKLRQPLLYLGGLMKLRTLLLSTVFPFCLLVNSAAQTVQSGSVLSEQDYSAEKILLPTPTGQYRIGRASFCRTDTSRSEPFTADSADHRQVVFHIWYPAEPKGGSAAPYIDLLPDNEIFRKSTAYSGFGIERLVKVRPHSFTGAKISEAKKRYPVIIFSHGLGMVSALYTTILENLSSHGYIVVGVDSPYFSSPMRLPDGRITRNLSQSTVRKGAREEEAVTQAQDLIFVLNELERLNKNAPDSGFTGRFDIKHVGVFGHSRGGFAAPHACFLDGRFSACLNLDGYPLTPAVMKDGIRQPYMHIEELAPWLPPPTDEELAKANQTREQAIKEAQEMEQKRETTFGKMSSGVYLVTVRGATHGSFSDGPIIAPGRNRDITINAERALTITNSYVLAFFDRYLKGHRQSLLKEGVSPTFPEVTLKAYRPVRKR